MKTLFKTKMTDNKENGLTNAFVIQILNSFIEGVIYILIPFLMLERNISIKSMGLIFAILPLVKQTYRLIFGMISDFLGRKRFYWLNGIMNVAYLTAFYFSTTALGFLIGNISQGLKSAALWSVNRAYMLDYSEKKERVLVKMMASDSIFYASGIMIAGFLITTFSYDKTLIFLILLSLLLFPNIKKLKDKNKENVKILDILKSFDFKNKSEKFKKFFLIFFIQGFYWGLIGGYILPLFLKEAGMTKEFIGLLLGIRGFLGGMAVFAFRSFGKAKDKLLICGILSSILIALFPFVDIKILSILIVIVGISTNISDIGQETIFVQAADSGSLAADIGFLMIGTHVGMTVTQALSGFLISSYGFTFLFITASVLKVLFSGIAFSNMD
ncbi:MAG: MFS transporter [Patescibacteria group bacterium]